MLPLPTLRRIQIELHLIAEVINDGDATPGALNGHFRWLKDCVNRGSLRASLEEGRLVATKMATVTLPDLRKFAESLPANWVNERARILAFCDTWQRHIRPEPEAHHSRHETTGQEKGRLKRRIQSAFEAYIAEFSPTKRHGELTEIATKIAGDECCMPDTVRKHISAQYKAWAKQQKIKPESIRDKVS
jgi:hypothetical protein